MVPGSVCDVLLIYGLLVLPFPLVWSPAVGTRLRAACVGVACPALGCRMGMEEVSDSTQDRQAREELLLPLRDCEQSQLGHKLAPLMPV